MRKVLKGFLGVILFILFTLMPSYGQFYYSGGQQNQLVINSRKICIKFEASVGQDEQERIIDSISRISSLLTVRRVAHSLLWDLSIPISPSC